MVEFNVRCPLCGEITDVSMLEDEFQNVQDNSDLILRVRCQVCDRIFAKYAYVIFGQDNGV
jgi:ribosomal protein S27E